MELNMTKKQKRSPSYPYFSLKECVEFIERLYTKDGLAAVPREVALKHMGFDISKNTAYRASSALTGFGLLEETGPTDSKVFQFTEIGRTLVIIKEDRDKRIEALHAAAYKYDIIKNLQDLWPIGLPSDDVIKLELLRKGFTERAAGRFVSVFRETYNYAMLSEYGDLKQNIISEEKLVEDKNLEEEKRQKPTFEQGEITHKNFDEYTLTLGKGKEIRLFTSAGLTKEDIDFMFQWIKRLDLMKSPPAEQLSLLDDNDDYEH
jgi:hypothetical protein